MILLKYLLEKIIRNRYRQQTIVQCIIFKNISKEAGYYSIEPIINY